MSKMGRGGGGVGSRMKNQNLPFEIDPDLLEEAEKGDQEGQRGKGWTTFPEYGPMILQAPIAEWERRQIQIQRNLLTKRRAGPFWTGTKEDWTRIDSESGKDAIPDPFEVASRGSAVRKGAKRSFKLADLTKVKLEPRFFPKELHKTLGHSELSSLDTSHPAKKRKLGLAAPTLQDKLAKFDEDAISPVEDPFSPTDAETKRSKTKIPEPDEDEVDIDPDEDDNDADKAKKNDGSPGDSDEDDGEPEDDMFEEDEDDAGNDYNAEQYFDGGDDDVDEGGGGDYGEDTF